MEYRLQEAGLWSKDRGIPEINISFAWSLLARLGLPGRYAGRSPDGAYEFVITNPGGEGFLTTGKGETLEQSMCEAVINVVTQSRDYPANTSGLRQ